MRLISARFDVVAYFEKPTYKDNNIAYKSELDRFQELQWERTG